jgi:drug/metabolite transporter (DMT)-like permease
MECGMRPGLVVGFLLLAALDTTAHLCVKVAAVRAAPLEPGIPWLLHAAHQPWLWVAIACYIGTFFTWMTVLRRAPVGLAFAASHMDVVTVLVASVALLHEAVSAWQIVGALMIVAGIAGLSFDPVRTEGARSRRVDCATSGDRKRTSLP